MEKKEASTIIKTLPDSATYGAAGITLFTFSYACKSYPWAANTLLLLAFISALKSVLELYKEKTKPPQKTRIFPVNYSVFFKAPDQGTASPIEHARRLTFRCQPHAE